MRPAKYILLFFLTSCSGWDSKNCANGLNNEQFFNYITITVYRGQKAVVNLRADTINHEKNATEILIEGEDIPVLKSGSFSHLSKLRHLTLRGNGIERLETYIFWNLSSLSSINMNSNNIKVIPENVFANLTVNKILLCCNGISKLDSFAFYNLPELNHLDLSHNNIKYLPANLFHVTTNLKVLRLNYNRLENVEDILLKVRLDPSSFGEAFYNVNKHEYSELDLSFNNYTRVDDYMFENVNSMTIINLANNNIKHISDRAFKDLWYLNEINLEGNYLEQISDRNLKVFEASEHVYLANNPWRTGFICRYEKWCIQFEKENTMDTNCSSAVQ